MNETKTQSFSRKIFDRLFLSEVVDASAAPPVHTVPANSASNRSSAKNASDSDQVKFIDEQISSLQSGNLNLETQIGKSLQNQLPEGRQYFIDFSEAANHFGSSWARLSRHAASIVERQLKRSFNFNYHMQKLDGGIAFVVLDNDLSDEENNRHAERTIRTIMRILIGGNEEEAELEESQSGTQETAAKMQKTATKPTASPSRQFTLTEEPPSLEFAEGWEFSEGAEIAPKFLHNNSGEPSHRIITQGAQSQASTAEAGRNFGLDQIQNSKDFSLGWDKSKDTTISHKIVTDAQTLSPTKPMAGMTLVSDQMQLPAEQALQLRLNPALSPTSTTGQFQLISQGQLQPLNFQVSLRFGAMIDLNNDVITTYLADLAQDLPDGFRSPFNSLISSNLSPPRAFAMDCLTVDIATRTLAQLREQGSQFILAMPINAMTLIRLKLRTKYLDRLTKFSDLERKHIRPVIYGLNETTAGQLHEIMGLLRGQLRAPIFRLPPDSEKLSLLVGERAFGVLIDGKKYRDVLNNLAQDRSSRIVRIAKAGNLKLMLYNPLNREQLHGMVRQDFDFAQIGILENAEEIPTHLVKINRAQFGLTATS